MWQISCQALSKLQIFAHQRFEGFFVPIRARSHRPFLSRLAINDALAKPHFTVAALWAWHNL